MHRSYWEIEVFAKDFQERRTQEAATRRRADEAARSASRELDNPFNLGIARFREALKTWFTSGRVEDAPRNAPVEGALAPSDAGSQKQHAMPQAMPGKVAQPYADMVVIARGPKVNVAEQASGVSDC